MSDYNYMKYINAEKFLSRLCYEHDVRPSVRPYVCLSVSLYAMLVDCYHTVQQKIKTGI